MSTPGNHRMDSNPLLDGSPLSSPESSNSNPPTPKNHDHFHDSKDNQKSVILEPALFLIEFKRRRTAGDRITARQFVDQEKIDDPEAIVDLAYIELLEEERLGTVGVEERLCLEFPEHAQELRRQIYFHRAMEKDDCPIGKETIVDDRTAQSRVKAEDTYSSMGLEIPGLIMVKRIGQGGMGVVFLAQQPALNRQVAVKLLSAGAFASNELRARFRAEAKMAASLRHPNIVQVYDVGETQGQPYLIMEYVDGGALDSHTAKKITSPKEAATTIRTLALALHETHRLGIFHRDLKPGNILLSRQSNAGRAKVDEGNDSLSLRTPKITDFGLAKFQQDEQAVSGAALTLAGDILGTPSYMAPEQAQGGSIGPWTDVYSLGAILYELLAGKPPFRGATPWETLQQVIKDEPPKLPRNLPLDLRTICSKCLMKRPHDRYTSMLALAEDLQRFIEGRPIHARRVSLLERAVSWCQRNRIVTSLTAVVILALVTLLGVTLWSRSQLQEMISDLVVSRKNESIARTDAVEHLWDSLISEARAQQSSGRVGHRTESVSAITQAIKLLPQVGRTPERMELIRDTAIASMALPEIKMVGTWLGPTLPNGMLIASDNQLNRVAQLNGEKITVTEELGERLITVITEPGTAHLAMSGDGRWLATCGNICRLMDLDHDNPKVVAEFPSSGYWGFSPDGSRLVGAGKDGLVIFNIPDNRIENKVAHVATKHPIAFARDNKMLALKSGDKILVIDFTTGNILNELPAGVAGMGNNCLAWHPNNIYLASALYNDEAIRVWDIKTGKIARSFRQQGLSFSLGFDDSGENLLFCSEWDGNFKVFDVESGSQRFSMQGSTSSQFVATTASVRTFLSSAENGKVGVWEFVPTKVMKTLTTVSDPTRIHLQVDISPMGDWLVVGSNDGLAIIDLQSKMTAANLPVGQPQNMQTCFDRFGRLWSCFDYSWVFWEFKNNVLCAPTATPKSNDFWPIQVDHSGTWTLMSNAWEVRLETVNEPKQVIYLGNHDDVRRADFSHDGRWVATCGWNGLDTKIWSVQDGKLITTLDTGPVSFARFSPDSRWLATSRDGGVVWDTSNWKVAFNLNSSASTSTGLAVAFSPDSRWLVNSRANGELQIWDVQRKKSLAILKEPNQTRIEWLEFTPDQRELYFLRNDSRGVVSVWNLEILKEELKTLGIDLPLEWTATKDRHEEPETSNRQLVVEENDVLRNLKGTKLAEDARLAIARNQWEEGLQLYRDAATQSPNEPLVLNNLAWNLLVCPPELRDSETALEMASRAIKLDGNVIHLNTLGTAQYRCGRLDEAVETLKQSLGDGTADTAAFDYYVLAACYGQLGKSELAQQMLTSGNAAEERVRSYVSEKWIRELSDLRKEAELAIAATNK